MIFNPLKTLNAASLDFLPLVCVPPLNLECFIQRSPNQSPTEGFFRVVVEITSCFNYTSILSVMKRFS